MPGSAGDMPQELSQLHERAQQVMQGIAQALWPSAFPGRRYEQTCIDAQRSTAALPIMEGVSLPARCERSLGHGKDAIRQG